MVPGRSITRGLKSTPHRPACPKCDVSGLPSSVPRAINETLTIISALFPFSLFVAVHHLGPLLLRPKEACQSTGRGRARSGQDKDQRNAGGKYRVQHRSSSASGRDPYTHV